MSKRVYYVINVIVAVTSIVSALFLIRFRFESLYGIIWLISAVAASAFVYLFKALRMYMVLMEQRISLNRFLRTYIKTTFVTLALPFKLGEIFRIFCFGNESKSWKYGFLSVVVDRYYDSVPLITMILIYMIFMSGTMSPVTVIILLFVITSTSFYLIYPSSSRYLNRFIITKTASKNSLHILAALDQLDNWFDALSVLVRGRSPLLVAFSCIAWLFEYLAIYCIARYGQSQFNSDIFFAYLNSVFIGNNDVTLSTEYISLGIMLFLFLATLHYGLLWINRRRVL